MSFFTDKIRGVGTSLSDRIRGLEVPKQEVVNPQQDWQTKIQEAKSNNVPLKDLKTQMKGEQNYPGLLDMARKAYLGAGSFIQDSTKKSGELLRGALESTPAVKLMAGVEPSRAFSNPEEKVAVASERTKKIESLGGDYKPYLEAFAQLETGGVEKPYSYAKPSGSKKLGRDLGRYQVTEGELKSYAQRYLGRKVNPDEFLKSPELQDKYMLGKIAYLKEQGASDERVFEIHRRGHNSEKGSGKSYAQKGLAFLQGSKKMVK